MHFPSLPHAGLVEKGLRVIDLVTQDKKDGKDFFNNFTPLNRQMKLLKILP